MRDVEKSMKKREGNGESEARSPDILGGA